MFDQQSKTCCPNSYCTPLPRKNWLVASWKCVTTSTNSTLHKSKKTIFQVLDWQHQNTQVILSMLTNETYSQFSFGWNIGKILTVYQNLLMTMPKLWHRDTNVRELFELQLYSTFICFVYSVHKTHSLISTSFLLVIWLTPYRSLAAVEKLQALFLLTGRSHPLTMQQQIHKARLH